MSIDIIIYWPGINQQQLQTQWTVNMTTEDPLGKERSRKGNSM